MAVFADDISTDVHLRWKKNPTRTSRIPPWDAFSRVSEVRMLLQKLLFPQNRACCASVLSRGLAQSWIHVLVIQYPSATSWNFKVWWMHCVTAAVQEMAHSCPSVPQDHLEESTKNSCEQASCISAKLSIKKLVSMQRLICHKNLFQITFDKKTIYQ